MSDIFGQAVMGHWQGDRETPLIVWRDDGHGDQQGPAMWFAEGLWPAEAAVADHVRGRVLDIGCGAGRHLLHFRRRGLEVTGLDSSPLALEVCRARGCDDLIEGDIRDVELPSGRFDSALLFGNNIGIGGTPGGVRKLLERLHGVVRERVVLVSVDVTGARDPKHLAYLERNRAARRSPGAMRIRLEYGADDCDWFDWLHPHPGQLRRLALSAGWRIAALETSRRGAYGAVLTPRPR